MKLLHQFRARPSHVRISLDKVNLMKNECEQNTRQWWSAEVNVSHEQTEWLWACVCGRLTASVVKKKKEIEMRREKRNHNSIRTFLNSNAAAAIAAFQTHMIGFDNKSRSTMKHDDEWVPSHKTPYIDNVIRKIFVGQTSIVRVMEVIFPRLHPVIVNLWNVNFC